VEFTMSAVFLFQQAPRDHERVVCKAIFCDVRHIAGAAAALHNSQIGSCHVVVFWSR
jgi:hypothetical protein